MTMDITTAQAQLLLEQFIKQAEAAYEEAGLLGLCHDGRWEYTIDQLRHLKGDRLLQLVATEHLLDSSDD